MKKPVDLVSANPWAIKVFKASRCYKRSKVGVLAKSAGRLPRWR